MNKSAQIQAQYGYHKKLRDVDEVEIWQQNEYQKSIHKNQINQHMLTAGVDPSKFVHLQDFLSHLKVEKLRRDVDEQVRIQLPSQ